MPIHTDRHADKRDRTHYHAAFTDDKVSDGGAVGRVTDLRFTGRGFVSALGAIA